MKHTHQDYEERQMDYLGRLDGYTNFPHEIDAHKNTRLDTLSKLAILAGLIGLVTLMWYGGVLVDAFISYTN